MSPQRRYTPGAAPLPALRAMHAGLRIQGAVLVQPSFYGTDNSCLLEALAQLGGDGRGIVVIDDRTPESALTDMDRLGVRGVRINPADGGHDRAALRRTIEETAHRVAAHGWHMQTFLPLATIVELADLFAALPTPIVFDHFAGATAGGIDQPGFRQLCALVETGNCYVKLSAPYHRSKRPPDYPDMMPLAHALLAARPDRILWGSDWPHPNSTLPPGVAATDISPFYPVDSRHLFYLLADWAPEASIRRRVLVDNPAALFGFHVAKETS